MVGLDLVAMTYCELSDFESSLKTFKEAESFVKDNPNLYLNWYLNNNKFIDICQKGLFLHK
jgi:hypothetical protein